MDSPTLAAVLFARTHPPFSMAQRQRNAQNGPSPAVAALGVVLALVVSGAWVG